MLDHPDSHPDGEVAPPQDADPDGPRAARLVAAIEVVAASGFPSQIGLSLLLLGLGFHPSDQSGGLSLPFVATVWTLDIVVLIGFILWRLRAGRESAVGLFFGARPIGREAMLGVAMLPLLFLLVGAVLGLLRYLAPVLHNVAANPFEGLVRSPLDAWILGALAVLSGGLKEEAQRAFVLHRFDQHLGGASVGLVVFSLVFGMGHFVQGWDVGVATTLLGFVWGVTFLRRRSVTAAVVSHAGFNVIQILQFTLVGGS